MARRAELCRQTTVKTCTSFVVHKTAYARMQTHFHTCTRTRTRTHSMHRDSRHRNLLSSHVGGMQSHKARSARAPSAAIDTPGRNTVQERLQGIIVHAAFASPICMFATASLQAKRTLLVQLHSVLHLAFFLGDHLHALLFRKCIRLLLQLQRSRSLHCSMYHGHRRVSKTKRVHACHAHRVGIVSAFVCDGA